MRQLLKDFRIRRLLIANTTGSIGSGITIFAVPWIMVHRAGGSDAYRWVTMATTVVLFLFMPHYGAWLDRHSRKTILLCAEAFGLVATASMGATGLILGRFELWQLTTIYFCGMLYFTLSYPARFAFIQQIFDRSQYQSLMGLIEVQGQAAQLLAGAGGAFLADRVPLWVILFLDASTYGVSYLVQSTIPYTSTHIDQTSTAKPPGVVESVAEGWRWLTRLTRGALDMAVEYSDVDFPGFYALSNQTIRIGADNPDNTYFNATISGDHEYKISGTRGSAPYLDFSTRRGSGAGVRCSPIVSGTWIISEPGGAALPPRTTLTPLDISTWLAEGAAKGAAADVAAAALGDAAGGAGAAGGCASRTATA